MHNFTVVLCSIQTEVNFYVLWQGISQGWVYCAKSRDTIGEVKYSHLMSTGTENRNETDITMNNNEQDKTFSL